MSVKLKACPTCGGIVVAGDHAAIVREMHRAALVEVARRAYLKGAGPVDEVRAIAAAALVADAYIKEQEGK